MPIFFNVKFEIPIPISTERIKVGDPIFLSLLDNSVNICLDGGWVL